ncbi:MAG: polysaccharide deacetylase family protein [Oscillospiraceae bacterium]|nr:polysaccharide deacetylase family protein [Oscillospiraceae bacterium]
MKKKVIYSFLLLIIVLLTACSSDDTPVINVKEPPLYQSTVEYGEPNLITDNKGPLWVYIRFPAAGNATDEIIAEWVRDIHKSSHDEIAELRASDPKAEGEINVQFDSYYVDDRYAGILENGMFMSSHKAHPMEFVRTFNIDTKKETLLDNTDILDYSQSENILNLLRGRIAEEYPQAVDHLGETDEKWLEHIAIGHEGIIVILERSKYLPSYLGTLKITLPYHKLGSAYILGTDLVPESPTEPPAKPPTKPIVPNAPPQSGDIDPSKPMVALTFDDGPSRYTSRILDILEIYGARATFCVLGNLVNARSDTVQRAFDLGCEIIGHSWDHRDLSKLTVDEITQELNETSDAIESITGVWPKLYRPPYGAVNNTLKSVSADLGYAIVYWSVDPLDWDTRNADKVYDAIMAKTDDRAIILSHDLYGSTADAMERVIPDLISKGYQLVTVSELMHYSNITLEAGIVYYDGK